MNFSIPKLLRSARPLSVALLLCACGGGNGTGAAGAFAFSISGMVTGLTDKIVLRDNGGDDLTIAADGPFTFATKVADNSIYKVTVHAPPIGEICTVSSGVGTVSRGDVSGVKVICSKESHTISAKVTGLSGTNSVVLQDNSADDLTVTANGTFTFANRVAFGSLYTVTVSSAPTGQNCSVANGTGTMGTADVVDITVSCATNKYAVGGAVSQLNGSMVLQSNASDNLVVSVNGPFTFPTTVDFGSSYNVTVLTQPTNQRCLVANSSGSVTGNVSNVNLSCASQMGGAMQGVGLNQAPSVSTLAGSAFAINGTGAAATFKNPQGIASDGTYLYVVDTGYNIIRRIEISTGVVTTLAGTGVPGATDGPGAAATFSSPVGIAIDGGNLYVAEMGNNKIRKIVIATGEVSSFTGVANAANGMGATDGAGWAATFIFPSGIASDGTNLYVTDSGNNKIRKIVIATGVVSSFTGVANTLTFSGAADGAAAAATFNYPFGITSDGTNLYVADQVNNKIRKIVIATGVVSSFTGVANTAGARSAVDGVGAAATFDFPMGITTDGINLYVADYSNHKIRKIVIATGAVSSFTGIANSAGVIGATDGAGSVATFSNPAAVTTAGGTLYVADTHNSIIRTVALSSAVVGTKAGSAYGIDGTGMAAAFNLPGGITSDGTNLYVVDMANHKIRKIVIATGVVTTLAGTGGAGATDGAGLAATFYYPHGITTDGTNLYVVDTNNNKIRKIVISSGVVSSLTGVVNTAGVAGAVDGTGVTASFNNPDGITTDGTNLYVADMGNNKIRRIVIASGVVSSITGVANTAGAGGAADGAGAAATFSYPQGITSDGSNLYVAEALNYKIRKIVIATGVVSSVTGMSNTAGVTGAADGTGTAATFGGNNFIQTFISGSFFGITTDGINLYLTDWKNNKIRKIAIATGVVSSVTGEANTAGIAGATDGAGSTATFSGPYGITSDGTSLYVGDRGNNTIRKIQ